MTTYNTYRHLLRAWQLIGWEVPRLCRGHLLTAATAPALALAEAQEAPGVMQYPEREMTLFAILTGMNMKEWRRGELGSAGRKSRHRLKPIGRALHMPWLSWHAIRRAHTTLAYEIGMPYLDRVAANPLKSNRAGSEPAEGSARYDVVAIRAVLTP